MLCPKQRAGLRRSGGPPGKAGGGQLGKGPEYQTKQLGFHQEDSREHSKVSAHGRDVATAGPEHSTAKFRAEAEQPGAAPAVLSGSKALFQTSETARIMPDDLCLFNSLLLNQILLFCIGCATTVLVTGASVGEMSLQMLVGWVCEELGVGEGGRDHLV